MTDTGAPVGAERRAVGLTAQLGRLLAADHGIGSVLLVPPFYADRRDQGPPPSPSAPAPAPHAKRLRKGQHGDVAQLLLTGIVAAQEVSFPSPPLPLPPDAHLHPLHFRPR